MNKLLRHAIIPLLVAMTAATASSCGSSRKIAADSSTVDYTVASAAAASDLKTEISTVASAYGEWERLRLPVKVELTSPKSMSVSGTATMIRDRAIHISLRFFGFEIGWMYLTPDSITIADKHNKRYMSEAIRPFLADAPVTIANVQDLLLGRMFEIGSATALTPAQAAKGTAELDLECYFIPGNETSANFSCGFALIPSASEISPLLLLATVIGGKGEPVQVKYDDATLTPAGPMSTAATLSYSTGKTPLEATLRWNFDKSRWGNDVELPSVSVRGYSRVTLDMIMAMISKL
ncbi:MAG: DUF4292 domain-containing protein [Paramuribaculum sp.]|nr:DUF4292 domain-containing protein [Paramuribaculum sp.]